MRPLVKSPVSVIVLALASSASPAGAGTSGQAPDTMIAMVQQVNARDSTVAVVYGVSLALQVVEITVAPHCHVSLKGSEADLGEIRRGQVVRVRYRVGRDGVLVADAIEVVRTPEDEP